MRIERRGGEGGPPATRAEFSRGLDLRPPRTERALGSDAPVPAMLARTRAGNAGSPATTAITIEDGLRGPGDRVRRRRTQRVRQATEPVMNISGKNYLFIYIL